jgi:ribonuclease HII
MSHMKKVSRSTLLVGIDEVGRGPLAGPVTVCSLVVCEMRILREFRGIKDSKQVTAKQREAWFAKLERARGNGALDYRIASAREETIDKKGMARCLKALVRRSLESLVFVSEDTRILLDGTLKAPSHYKNQLTIIRGDETERVIAMASIIAKVKRDHAMARFARRFPGYGFEIHKGYGTRAHYEALERLGPCPLHRKTFLHKTA